MPAKASGEIKIRTVHQKRKNGDIYVNFQSFYNSNSPNSTCLSMERSADLLKR